MAREKINPPPKYREAKDTEEDVRRKAEQYQAYCRQETAEHLATQYDIDENRVYAVFDRMDATRWVSDPNGYRPLYVPFQEALSYFGRDKALDLFEKEDLALFDRRVMVFLNLANTGVPLYSLEEMVSHAEHFIGFLERNRRVIVATGHPSAYFARCHWLDAMLGRLYYVRVPYGIQLGEGRYSPWECNWGTHGFGVWGGAGAERLQTDEWGDVRLEYRWIKTLRDREGTPITATRGLLAPAFVDQEATSILDGLEEEDVERLERLRSKLFDLKLDVLRVVLTALKVQNAGQLWEKCVAALHTHGILYEDAEFLLRVDRFYLNRDLNTGEVIRQKSRGLPGGLTDLLSVVGHCEKEVRLRTLDRAHEGLRHLINERIDSTWRFSISGYFGVLRDPERERIVEALDDVWAAGDEERKFIRELHVRVNRAVEELDTTVTTRVPHHLADVIGPLLRSVADEAVSRHGKTGESIGVRGGEAAENAVGGNMFRKDGPIWTVVYREKRTTLKDRKGARYLAVLVHSPGVRFPASTLRAIVSSAKDDYWLRLSRNYADASKERLETEGLSVDGILDDVKMTENGLREIKRRLLQLQEEQEERSGHWSPEEEERHAEEVAKIEQYLGSAQGPGGRPRRLDPTSKNDATAVYNSIGNTKKEILKVDERLWQHLHSCLNTGAYFSYDPPDDTHWD